MLDIYLNFRKIVLIPISWMKKLIRSCSSVKCTQSTANVRVRTSNQQGSQFWEIPDLQEGQNGCLSINWRINPKYGASKRNHGNLAFSYPVHL